jgi:hypothetical protein
VVGLYLHLILFLFSLYKGVLPVESLRINTDLVPLKMVGGGILKEKERKGELKRTEERKKLDSS